MMLEVLSNKFIRMERYSILILITTILLTLINGEIVNNNIINKNVERTIDLTSQLVKISTTITLENTGKESAKSFLLTLDRIIVGNLSYISVQDSLKDQLKLIPTKINNGDGNDELKVFSFTLKQPLASGRTTVVYVESIFTKGLIPYPSSITQKEKQLVRYFGNHYFYSPYKTVKQTTIVTLSSRNIESYTKLKPFTQQDQTITYGPYENIPKYSYDEMVIHYENHSPFLTVTHLERLIEISHWGNIAIEENIEILHTGAKLKGPFSRYDYQRDTISPHHSIKSYRTILPASAHSIYYRDSNGNISTSQVRVRKDWIELELRPRFPLFGGWRSSYTLGYSVPSYQYLYRKSKDEFVLNMRLIDHVFDDMHVEELETSLVLPVGVSNIKITTPYDVERLPDGVTYKFFDKIGRTVIKLRKTNLVEQHIQDIEVTYNWQTFLLLHEPILLALALYLLFVFVIVYVRIDFSYDKPEHGKKD